MITTGYSSNQIDLNTQGSGKTYTHIESEVNGQKQVFETDQPGHYELNFEAPAQSSPAPSASPKQEPTEEQQPEESPEPAAAEPSPTASLEEPPPEIQSQSHQVWWQVWISRIKEKIERFFGVFA